MGSLGQLVGPSLAQERRPTDAPPVLGPSIGIHSVLGDCVAPAFPQDIVRELKREIKRLKAEVEVLANRLSEESAATDVTELRQVSREEAKAEILTLLSRGEPKYMGDIAEELSLELQLVVEICKELMSEGRVGSSEGAVRS